VPGAQNINFADLAKAAGYAATYSFEDIEAFSAQVGKILAQQGPVFVAIKIVPEVENAPIGMRQRRPVRPRAESIRVLQQELGITSA
jgi:thiamine pyrophosphate-dependent acetolactate synthase large subunit-like protein